MNRLLFIFSLSAAVAAIAALFDKRITLHRNLRAFANSEIIFSILLLFVAFPSYFLAGTNRAFFPGSDLFWLIAAAIGLIWLVLGINLSFGRTRFAKILFYAAIVRCLLPIVGWFFSWVSISYYRKAKTFGELNRPERD